MADIKKGIYRHYKGGEYRVLYEAADTEGGESRIIYQDLHDEKKIWARPKSVFLGEANLDGQQWPRFELIREEDSLSRHPEVVVGPVIYNDQGKVLLIKNPKFKDFWTIPGGHIELNETAEDALRREIMEETGLELKNIEVISFDEGINPQFFHKKKHFIYLNYLAEVAGGQLTKSSEMTEYIWADPLKLTDFKLTDSVKPLINYYLEKKQNNHENWENRYKRALADYQNLLKQTAKDKEEFVKYAIGDFLQDILPVYDHLKLSLVNLGEEIDSNPWVAGVRHVLKQFKDVLNSRGIEEIKTVGEDFDHQTMEAIDGSGEKVKQEIMPGYKLNGKVIRAAKVIVK